MTCSKPSNGHNRSLSGRLAAHSIPIHGGLRSLSRIAGTPPPPTCPNRWGDLKNFAQTARALRCDAAEAASAWFTTEDDMLSRSQVIAGVSIPPGTCASSIQLRVSGSWPNLLEAESRFDARPLLGAWDASRVRCRGAPLAGREPHRDPRSTLPGWRARTGIRCCIETPAARIPPARRLEDLFLGRVRFARLRGSRDPTCGWRYRPGSRRHRSARQGSRSARGQQRVHRERSNRRNGHPITVFPFRMDINLVVHEM